VRVKLVIRELRSAEEFQETTHVSKAAWGYAERSISPASDLVAATHAGGLTAAAFEGKKMLGFVHGIPRTNLDEPCQHSHLLAVRPDAQGRGLSVLLKLFQRKWCLEHGIRLATWTYDPFLIKNANLNIRKLRGTVSKFLPNFYGFLGGIYHSLPTDRFEVRWRLDDPGVERAAHGEGAPPVPDLASLPVATPRSILSAPRLLLPFPKGAPALYRKDPEGSLRARRRFGKLAKALFDRGYVVTGVEETPGNPVYVLEHI
jgi:predicted GNAT superfamily acetyltransferase